ncbi:hypothetical protein HOLleu_17547 [Holothuria leucospilota]|uniref:Uncharacterized protein n=1 Tax=Holothuria leucospilota TaxID=206669 RepID=A0A9Q1C2G1_HOLLE|nr:hypothetical protein HOLleu_17547 [Holothuria leucospilota]
MADNSIDAELAALHVVMSDWNLHARTADGGLVLPSVYFEEDEDENEQTEKLEVESEGMMEENEDLKKQGLLLCGLEYVFGTLIAIEDHVGMSLCGWLSSEGCYWSLQVAGA